MEKSSHLEYHQKIHQHTNQGAEYHHIHQNVEAGWYRLPVALPALPFRRSSSDRYPRTAGTAVIPVAVLPVVDLTGLGHIPEKNLVQVCLYSVFPEEEEVQTDFYPVSQEEEVQ